MNGSGAGPLSPRLALPRPPIPALFLLDNRRTSSIFAARAEETGPATPLLGDGSRAGPLALSGQAAPRSAGGDAGPRLAPCPRPRPDQARLRSHRRVSAPVAPRLADTSGREIRASHRRSGGFRAGARGGGRRGRSGRAARSRPRMDRRRPRRRPGTGRMEAAPIR